MICNFADTSYFVALLQPADRLHQQAVKITATRRAEIIASEWALVELANFFCRPELRGYFTALLHKLDRIGIEVVAADRQTFAAGFDLFEARTDKSWSLTDCMSFALMTDRGIRDALTADHHFEQAGFNVLLK